MSKERIDKILIDNNYFKTREEAKRHLMAGLVLVDNILITKPGQMLDIDSIKEIRIKGKECPYVSRGGYKLEKAISYWNLDLTNKIMLDVGSSTGGFTDCALQNGIKEVYALDVGTNQLVYDLRIHPQVSVFEKTNFRTIADDFFDKKFDIITMDVSFISITLLLKNVKKNLKDDGIFVCLIKPQFEADKEAKRNKNGVIRDEKIHQKVIEKIQKSVDDNEMQIIEIIDSPITGAKGNKEFLALIKNK